MSTQFTDVRKESHTLGFLVPVVELSGLAVEEPVEPNMEPEGFWPSLIVDTEVQSDEFGIG
jgi:hypothetical protein